MFTTLIVQPIFNLLVLIYALLPGHNFGVAIIIFTVLVRLLLWPLVKKQLHQAKVMRQLQPELKKIKAATKGDRQKEGQLMMELYKEKGVNPIGSFGLLLLQFPILIGLYSGLRKVIEDPKALVTFSYPAIQHLPWIQQLSHNIHLFDSTFLGIVQLDKAAYGPAGIYWPAMIIVVASAIMQYFQSVQLMPTDKDARGIRAILKDTGTGKQADQSEINAAIGRSTKFMLPAVIFFITVNLASALSLYWLVGGIVAVIQQGIVLREDTVEMEAEVETNGNIEKVEAEVINPKPNNNKNSSKKKNRPSVNKKRRRK